MAPVSFDPMAHVYDTIRGYPEEVARQIAQAIDQAAQGNTHTRFLEVGVGTGRVALPLAERGHQYTGIDISQKMLGQLEHKLIANGWQQQSLPWGSQPDEDMEQKPQVQRFVHTEKHASMRLLVSDMTDLPFRDQSFDVVIAVHVFHLVSAWQQALRGIMRVLRPGGMLLLYWNENWHDHWQPGSGDLRREWCAIIKALGGSTEFPGVSEPVVTAWLQQQGFETQRQEMLTWEQQITPQTHYQSVLHYHATGPWSVPEDMFAASLQHLQHLMHERYGDDLHQPFTEKETLLLSTARKPDSEG